MESVDFRSNRACGMRFLKNRSNRKAVFAKKKMAVILTLYTLEAWAQKKLLCISGVFRVGCQVETQVLLSFS